MSLHRARAKAVKYYGTKPSMLLMLLAQFGLMLLPALPASAAPPSSSYLQLSDISSLRSPGVAAGPVQFAHVASYMPGRGVGGGDFRFDPASTAPPDRCNVFAPSAGPGRWTREQVQRGVQPIENCGADPTGEEDSSVGIAAADTVAAAESGGVYGGAVTAGRGRFRLDRAICLHNNVTLSGVSMTATQIFGGPSLNAVDMISNCAAGQEFFALRDIDIVGGGSVSDALVRMNSVFANSSLQNVLIYASPAVGLRIHNANGGVSEGMGPILFTNVWVNRSARENVLIDEDRSPRSSAASLNFFHLTAENQGLGYANIAIRGQRDLATVAFFGLHEEMQGCGPRNAIGIDVDGVSGLTIEAWEFSSTCADTIGIQIEDNPNNQRIAIHNAKNWNGVKAFISDRQNGFSTYRNIDYQTPDLGVLDRGPFNLIFDSAVVFDGAQGSYGILAVLDSKPMVLANPTNVLPGQKIYFEIVNASNGSIGAVTFGTHFLYGTGSIVWPPRGMRTVLTFFDRDRTGNLVFLGQSPAS